MNDGKQYTNNNNNDVTKYFESNKNRILDLAGKNHENLVEELTNNIIDVAALHPV